MKYFILLTLLISLFVISGCTNGTLQVHVENAENMPLEDVSIKIQSNVSENFLITDSKGNVSIELTPRVYSAEIQKEGFNTEAIKDIQIISKKITEKNVILKEVTEESCQDLGGKICEPENSCNGKLIESTDTTNCCIGNCLEEPIESNSDKIFIAIDSGSYKNLEEEITRFTEDIKKDTKTVPILKIYNSETNKNVIKSDIKEISDGFELKGLILIGNMPFGEVRKSEYHTYPSDVYYLDIDNKCEYDQEGLIDHHSLWETCYFALSYFEIPFWVGRIKPPVSGNEGIELMRNYFNRNHAYRIGNQQYEKEMLAYLEIYEDPNSEELTIEAAKKNFVDYAITWGGLYTNENELEVIVPAIRQGYDDCSLDETFLDRLENKTYEYVFVNAHGDPTNHRCNITPEKLKNNDNKGLFYVLTSCSTGDYSEENYLGGWYLFGGEGLVVYAPTDSVTGASIIDSMRDSLLSKGLSIGEASRLNNNIHPVFSLLGDPTIKLRETPKSEANIQVNIEKIEFEDIEALNINEECNPKKVNFEVTNTGKKDLIISTLLTESLSSFKELTYNNSKPLLWIGFPDLDSTWGEVTIKPGKTFLAEAGFCPYSKGTYSGTIVLFSNAENQPVVKIPFTGRGK